MKITIEKAIEQLEDLKKDREGFAKTDEHDGVFTQDIEAIDMAVKAIIEAMEVKSGSDVLKILKLEEENKELKRLLRLAIEDIKICLICECVHKICSEQACHCSTNAQCKKICKWKHADEAMKLIGSDNHVKEN